MIVFETLLLDHQIFGSESVNGVENTFQIRICIFSKESGKNFESHVKSVSFELKIEKRRRERCERSRSSAPFISTDHSPN